MRRSILFLALAASLLLLAQGADAQTPVYQRYVQPVGMTAIGNGPNTNEIYYPSISNYTVSTFSLTAANGWNRFTGGTRLCAWNEAANVYHYYTYWSVPLGFNFHFFGNQYSSVTVNINGVIYFTNPTYYYYTTTNQQIGNSNYLDGFIAGCWDNMCIYYYTTYTYICSNCGLNYYTTCPYGEVRYQTTGTAGNHVFTVQYYRVPHYYPHYNFGWTSFQIKLFESDNHIEIVYENHAQNMVDQPNYACYWSTYYAFGATIGIESPAGNKGFGGPNTGISNGHQTVNYRFDPVPPIVDDGSRYFDLPPDWDANQGFDFYGTRYTRIHVSTNGIVTFGAGTSDATNDPIPNANAPNNYIALFWDDLKVDQVGTWDRIAYTIQGAPGYRMCIIEYNKMTVKANPSLEITGQIVLNESDNSIELRYDSAMPAWSGMSATIGIEDGAGAIGLGGPNTTNSISTRPANNYKYIPIYAPDPWTSNTLNVPATSSTGNYTVTWTHTMRAAWFELQEGPSATGPWTTVYGGPTDQAATALSYSAINRSDGTYWYRVIAYNIAGSNTWMTSTNGCTVAHPPLPPVSILVPFSDDDGTYNVDWENSPSSGTITYHLEVDTDPNFSAPTAIPGPYTSLGGPQYYWRHTTSNNPNATYYYRVRADKGAAGMSGWTYGANGCTVQLPPPGDPSGIDVYEVGGYPTPMNPETDNDGSYEVHWGAATGSGTISYQVQEATNPQFMGAVQVYSGTGLSVSLSGRTGSPPLGQQYYYRVRASNSSGWSNWVSDLSGVTVIILPPAQPVSIEVHENNGGVPGIAITQDDDGDYWVVWSGVTGATSYMLQESINPTIVGSSLAGAVTLYQGTATQYHITGKGNGVYYYQVQAWNSSGSSAWTVWGGTVTPQGLTVLLPPAAPTGLGVPTTDVDGVYQVSWNASPGSEGVDQYQIQEGPSASGPWTDLTAPEFAGGTATQANVGIPAARSNGTYWYRVRAHNSSTANGGWGNWATSLNGCVVLHPPASPSALAAYNETPGVTPITQDVDGDYYLEWNAVPFASSYELQEYQGPPAPDATTTWVTVYSGPAQTYHAQGKTVGTFYYRVRAVNTSGTSAWYPLLPTTVDVEIIPPALPGAIYLPSPPQSATGSYVIGWDASLGATGYELQESPDDSVWTTVYTGPNTTYTVYGKTSGNYYYRVRASNGAGFSTGWTSSSPAYVEIIAPLAPATLTVPSHTISGYFTVSWAVSLGATGYRLEESTDPTFTTGVTTVYDGAATSFYVTGRGTVGGPAIILYYRVQAYNVVGDSATWRTTPVNNTCIVDLQAPQPPATITVPSTSSTGAYTATWATVDGATSYELQESTDSGFATAATIYTGAGTSYNVAGKTNGTYYYRVRAVNVVGPSGWQTTPANTCVVDLQPPSPPMSLTVPLSSFTGIITLTWATGSGALWYEIQEDEDPNFGSPVVAYLGSGTSCLLTGRTNGTYSYRIRSVNTVGASSWMPGSNACMVSIIGSGLGVQAGPTNPAASSELPTGSQVPMLQVRAANNSWSDIQVQTVTVTASGTGNLTSEVQAVELWNDADGDGRVGTSDTLMGTTTFPVASTTATFSGLNHHMTANEVEHWLVVMTFNNASVGTTYALTLVSNADVGAVDLTWGNNVVVEGAPIAGGSKLIQSTGAGDLSVYLGPKTPVGQHVDPGTGSTTLVQLVLSAGSIDDVMVTRMRFTATGSGLDNLDVVNVRLYEDVDADGALSGTDTLVGSGTYSQDNGMITFSGLSSVTVAAGTAEHFILVYDFASGIAGEQSYAALILTGGDFAATGVGSSQAIVAQGAPVVGTYTLVGTTGGATASDDDPEFAIGGCQATFGTPGADQTAGWLLPLMALALAACVLRLRRKTA